MSLHSSLKSDKFKEHRTVRTRMERLEKLQLNLQWLDKNRSVYGLPKEVLRRLKYKIKKEKEEVKEITSLYVPPTEESNNEKNK